LQALQEGSMIHISAAGTSFLSFLVALLFVKWLFLRSGRKPSHGDSAAALFFAVMVTFIVLGIFRALNPNEFWGGYIYIGVVLFLAMLAFVIHENERSYRKQMFGT
jgi:quinol-cytochrome oxidoreductase complex cytochrome b subunit